MEFQVSLLPEISVSPPPPQDPIVEPFSPFVGQPSSPGPNTAVDDGYRSNLLSPPPTSIPSRFHRQQSPLCPEVVRNKPTGQGLDVDRFQRLLASSKERNTAINGKRSPDLRKEIAIKAHKTKQLERRALFLSKINAPPSPSATLIPKTPPESPAIFHYSLPSPGLDSPLSIYDTVDTPDDAMITPWVEQVDFRRQSEKKSPRRALPSLDQISAHLTSNGHGTVFSQKPRSRAPLPAFLRSAPRAAAELSEPKPATAPTKYVPQPPTPRPVLPAAPLAPSPKAQTFAELMPAAAAASATRVRRSPRPLEVAALQVTTTVVPRSSRPAQLKLTESNLALLSSRERTGLDMMSALRRRTIKPSSERVRPLLDAAALEERKARRISAPAELQKRERHGFSHPVLALPGAF